MCVRIVKQPEMAVWDATGDNVRTVVAHHGEDSALVLKEYRRLHPGLDRVAVIAYAFGVLPRPALCSKASVAAALKIVRSEIDTLPPEEADALRWHWVGLCEQFSIASKAELGR